MHKVQILLECTNCRLLASYRIILDFGYWRQQVKNSGQNVLGVVRVPARFLCSPHFGHCVCSEIGSDAANEEAFWILCALVHAIACFLAPSSIGIQLNALDW